MLTQTQLEQLQNDQLVNDLEKKGYNFDTHTRNQFRYWRRLFIQTHNEVKELEREKVQLTLDIFKLTIEKNEAENGRLNLLAERNIKRENLKKRVRTLENNYNSLQKQYDLLLNATDNSVRKLERQKRKVDNRLRLVRIKKQQQNQTINKLQGYQSYLAKKKKKTMKQCQQRVDNLKANYQ